MPAAITSVLRTSSLFVDQDLDGVFDPGDVVLTRIRFTNTGNSDATGISVTDTLNGVTLVPGSVQVTPIAFDDTLPSMVGNTPLTIGSAALLGNDVDPDGAEVNLTITGVSNATNGTIVNNGNGTFTFTPTTGFVGTASFQYTITDEQGLGSVTTGVVTVTVTDPVWYVDASYTGVNGASDGSYLKPFTSLVNLSTGGSADALDNADDTIFVYNTGTYTSGIVLEAGQKLYGDGHAFSVNGLTIGANASNSTIDHAGVGVTLSTNNTVMGVTLNGTANGAVGVEDGGVNVGTFTMDESSITGLGKAVDIDQGGTLAVDLDQMSSASSTSEGVHLQGTTGSFNAATGTIQTSTGTGVLIGAAGGGTASSGGNVNFTFGGDISSPGGSLVEIQDRTGGTVDFNGILTEGSIAAGTTGILIDGSAGTINFDGQTFVSAGGLGGNGVTLTNNTGTINFNATGTGLDITTATGSGLTFTGGGTLNITGAANSINTTTGQIMVLANGSVGAAGITFQTLSSSGVSTATPIDINNLDGNSMTVTGNVTIANTSGVGIDAINIRGGSSTNFGFNGITDINGATGDGVELNGANGTVTFANLTVDAVTGMGLQIVGATNAVTVTAGAIGATNDPAGDAVHINGGTGAVTVAANVTKAGSAGNVVEVTGHSGGAITFSGNIVASGGTDNGIKLTNNTGGNITFSGDKALVTGASTGIDFTNTAGTGANVSFTNGDLNVNTTFGAGTGINATSSTVGAGSLTISGANNIIAAATGRAINIDGVTSNVTLQSVGVSGGGTTTGIFLKNTGSGGQFVVTGTGTVQGSGGTIANIGGGDMGSAGAAATGGTGLYMENVSNVSLSNMIFGANAGTMTNFGIRGENVNNFTLTDSEFRGAFGDNVARDEDTIRFGTGSGTTGLTGTAVFQGNNIQGGRENNLSVYVYGNNTLNLTIRDTVGGDQAVFGNNSTAGGANHSFLMESGGTSNVTLNVNGVAFNGANGSLLAVTSVGSAVQNLQILNNTFHNAQVTTVSGNAGVSITGSLTGSNITYNITDNSFKGTTGSSIFAMFNGNSGTVNGIVHSNDFGTNNGVVDNLQANYGSLNGGAFFGGIDSKFVGTGTINYAVRLSDNTVRDSGSDGVFMFRSAAQDLQGTARVEATITNNTIDEARTNVAGGVYVQVAGTGAGGRIGINMTGNNIDVNDAAFADAVVVDNGNSLNGQAYFPGYAGPSAPNTELSTFLTSAPRSNIFGAGSQDSGTGGASVNPGGTLNGQAFVLAVPMMAATPDVGNGWQDNADLYVSAIGPARGGSPTVQANAVSGSVAAASIASQANADGSVALAAIQAQLAGELHADRPRFIADAALQHELTRDYEPTAVPAQSDQHDWRRSTDWVAADGDDIAVSSGNASAAAADDGVISRAELDLLLAAAIERWAKAGATAEQLAAMRAVEVGVVDMAGIYVGTSEHGVISIDSDGAGFGWFVDMTPGDDSEFEGSGTRLTADAGGAAAGRLDLLTVLIHELGHQIGLDDEYASSEAADVMFGYMNVGERRLPASGEAVGAVPGSVGATAFALTPVAVGTLPAGKTVDVFFKATIDSQTNGFIANLANTATVSGSNFTTIAGNENNTLDSLTLGNLVFNDLNGNGLFDGGDTGINGVAVTLFADTNNNGSFDLGTDTQLGTATTAGGGLYSFAGLAPGNYIVRLDAANFNAGGAIAGFASATGGGADPDDNVDNDDNGVVVGSLGAGGYVVSQTITLAYNTEPTNGTGNDTNTTLDFGFANPNDAPVNSLGGTIGTGEDAIDAWLSGMSISDPDANPATDDIRVVFQVGNGTLDIRTDVVGGVTAGEVTGDDTGTITVIATINQINATLAATNGLTYSPTANFNGDDTLTVTTNDQGHSGVDPGLTGDATSEEDIDQRTITVSAVDDAPVAQPDAVTTPENAVLNGGAGALFADNGSGVDSDVDGPALSISAVNGSGANVGNQITLASGAKVTVNADGSYSYDPSGKFAYLISAATAAATGAVNDDAPDTFTYTLTGGNTVTVTVNVTGVDGAGDELHGDAGANTITDLTGINQFRLQQGGNDTVFGQGGNDTFYFGGAFTGGDSVDGGADADRIVLQGNYSGGVTLGAASYVGVEQLVLLPGNDTGYGDTADNVYDYSIILLDAALTAGQILTVDGAALRAGEDLSFNGSAETNASFVVTTGLGTNSVSGGALADTFIGGTGFDTLTGNGGADSLSGGDGNDVLRADSLDTTIDGGTGTDRVVFAASGTTAATWVGIEQLELVGGANLTLTGTQFTDYLPFDAGIFGTGTVTINIDVADEILFATMMPTDPTVSFVITGSAGSDVIKAAHAANTISGGDGSDHIRGGNLADVIVGGNDRDKIIGWGGSDTLTGNAGDDVFRYLLATDSGIGLNADRITDFVSGSDKLDFRYLDSDLVTPGVQPYALTFVGTTAFDGSGNAEIRYGTTGADLTVELDLDGNGTADMQIVLQGIGAGTLTNADFLL